jgi:hypothetical protein
MLRRGRLLGLTLASEQICKWHICDGWKSAIFQIVSEFLLLTYFLFDYFIFIIIIAGKEQVLLSPSIKQKKSFTISPKESISVMDT